METKQENNLFLCDRIQKITEALYRVTELFSDKEPLKWQLRSRAIELFDFLLALENGNKQFFDIGNVSSLLRKLGRILQLASFSDAYISSMNFEILRREYLSLADFLESQPLQPLQPIETIQELVPFSISNGHPLRQLADDGNGSNGQPLRQLADGELSNGHNGHSPAGEKEYKEDKEYKENNGKEKNNGNGQPILCKERKRKILDLISAKGGSASGGKEGEWLSIREISAFLPEFGEKSIQRDLLEMVEAGILRKTGDKRWRKYCLV